MNWAWFIALVCVTPGFSIYHERSGRIITGPTISDANFGFSISSVSKGPTSKLVVGSPLADSIGQIYTCNLTSKENACTSVDNTVNQRPYTDIASRNQRYWFGATVMGTADFFVGCAPRSIDDTYAKIFTSGVGTFGHCFQYQDTKAPMLLKPISLQQRKKDLVTNTVFTKMEETMDSFGWSLSIASDNSVLIGSPAMISGRIMIPRKNRADYFTGSKANTSFNFGYAVASGKFFGSKNSIAVGSPYGINGFGNVAFIEEKKATLRFIKEMVGSTVGSMYGAVLCPAYLTAARRLTDLLVGAPTFTTENGNDYNVGAVYVYVAEKLTLKRTIVGESSGSHFGHAIISLGDLNHDNIDDIAIAAPYEGDGRGTVYLYSGADIMMDGSLLPMQTITPELSFKSFGYSLTALRDYDDNGCNELAIGAPESNKVLVLRCLAAMTIKLLPFASTVAGTNGVDKMETLQLCLDAKFPNKPSMIKADILVNVQIHHDGAKLDSPKDGNVQFNIRHTDTKKSDKYCKPIKMFMSGTKGDYNKKIKYVLSASLVTDPLTKADFESSEVVLNKDSKKTLNGSIWAQECGNRACVPKLKMNIKFSETSPYTIGSSASINASISVDNSGEVAYDTCMRVKVVGAGLSDVCKIVSTDDAGELMLCKPKQLLRKDSPWSLETMALDTTRLTNEDKSISITVELYDKCDSKITFTNTTEFYLLADAASVKVFGRTDEGQDDMVNLTRTDISMKKTFEHVYTISNTGLTNWVNIGMTLSVQKQDFVTVSFINEICKAENTTDSDEAFIYSCFAPKLNSNAKLEVIVRMQVVPDVISARIDKETLTVYSNILVDLDGTPRNASVTSELRLIEGKIPIWIIIVASILALIILVIIFFILRECGFLKRKNKENLKRARMSVRRQTIMRQSSQNRPRSEDQERLTNEANASQENQKKKKDRRVVVNDF